MTLTVSVRVSAAVRCKCRLSMTSFNKGLVWSQPVILFRFREGGGNIMDANLVRRKPPLADIYGGKIMDANLVRRKPPLAKTVRRSVASGRASVIVGNEFMKSSM